MLSCGRRRHGHCRWQTGDRSLLLRSGRRCRRSGRCNGLSRSPRARNGRTRDRRSLWRSWCGRRCGGCCLCGRSSNRAGWRGLFLRQVGNCDFHRAIDRDSGKAFVLIDPSVRCEVLLRFFVQRFQLFHTLFCACFFVITCARRRSDHPWRDNPGSSRCGDLQQVQER